MTNQLAARIGIGGLSSISVKDLIPADALKDIHVGVSNPWFKAGLSSRETYNRLMLPVEGGRYGKVGGKWIKIGGRDNAVTAPPGNMGAVWDNMAANAGKYLKKGVDLGGHYANLKKLGEALSAAAPGRTARPTR